MANIVYKLELLTRGSYNTGNFSASFASASGGAFYPVLASNSNSQNPQGPVFLYTSPLFTASVSIPSQSYNYLQFKLVSQDSFCGTEAIYTVTGLPTASFAYVSWSLSETLSPTVNADLLITSSGVDIVSQFAAASGSFNATSSATIFFQGYNSGSQSWPTQSTLFVTASKDGVGFFSGSSAISGSIISSSFTALSGSTYLITVSSSYSGSAPAPTGYEYMGKFVASNTIVCAPTTPLKNLWLTTADSASYVAASNTFSAGMVLYSSAAGATWIGGNRLYDANNPAIWNVVSGELTTVFQFC